jgi:peptidyl-prolyl cis-trans isomerase C
MKKLTAALVLLLAVPAYAQNARVVNGKPISSAKVDAFVSLLKKQGQQDSPELRKMVTEELVNREILLQEAEKRGVQKKADVQTELDFARQGIVIRALLQDYLAKHPVTEAEVQAEYEKFKKAQGDKEYRARHILVEKEEDAKAIVAKLKGGAKFEELAKQSKDTGSAANGGDLDWAAPSNYVKPFSEALVALKKGEMTQTPVQSQFGWHVIRLDDVRDAQFPPVDQVKPQIEERLKQQKVAQFQQDLKSKAKVQ